MRNFIFTFCRPRESRLRCWLSQKDIQIKVAGLGQEHSATLRICPQLGIASVVLVGSYVTHVGVLAIRAEFHLTDELDGGGALERFL